MLRISPKNKEFHRKAHPTTKSATDSVMCPSAYSVVLVRDSDETFKIDRSNHGYLPSGFKENEMWDEENQTLILGEKESEKGESSDKVPDLPVSASVNILEQRQEERGDRQSNPVAMSWEETK